MRRYRFAIAAGLTFIVTAAIYLALSHDFGGATTLTGLGIAMALMSWALTAGTADES